MRAASKLASKTNEVKGDLFESFDFDACYLELYRFEGSLGSKVRLRGPANFLSWAQLSSAQKFWAHVGHYLRPRLEGLPEQSL